MDHFILFQCFCKLLHSFLLDEVKHQIYSSECLCWKMIRRSYKKDKKKTVSHRIMFQCFSKIFSTKISNIIFTEIDCSNYLWGKMLLVKRKKDRKRKRVTVLCLRTVAMSCVSAFPMFLPSRLTISSVCARSEQEPMGW